MSLLERLRRLIASNVNALFDSLTDPGAQIDELIGNMEDAARDARSKVKDALVEDKRAEKHRDAIDRSIAEWTARAERAVKAGDDHLAREALSRRTELEAELATIDGDRSKARVELDEMTRALRELDAKLQIVKSRKETLKEVMRVRARGDDAAARFDRFVTDVDAKEAEVELGRELGDTENNQATTEVRQKIEKLETDREVTDRLAALKEKMKK